MLVAIGVLAHNEAHDIANLISDLGYQTLLSDRDLAIEIHVVANGCTDATVDVAKKALAAAPFRSEKIKTFVHELERAGKSNAWNELVHIYLPPDTKIVFLSDADIRIPEANSLQLMLDALVQSNTAQVAVDRSVKDLSEAPRKSMVERLILAGSGRPYETRTAIAGGLYCARFDTLKGIWMPVGLPGEDGFLRAMILTTNFTRDEDLSRITFVSGARHIFESERSARAVFRHNIRLTIGTAINVLLFHHFRASPAIRQDVAGYVRRRNASDPSWVNELIADERKRGKYFIVHRGFLLKRFNRLVSLPTEQKFARAPALLMGFLFDLALFFTANHLMRRGIGAGYW